VLEDVQPLLRDARAAQPRLRQVGSRLDRLTRNAAPLVTDLRAARAGDAARATISLADDLQDGRHGPGRGSRSGAALTAAAVAAVSVAPFRCSAFLGRVGKRHERRGRIGSAERVSGASAPGSGKTMAPCHGAGSVA
jgi:hypothetical protein